MELPILQAIDTTGNWNNSNTALGPSELAIEIETVGSQQVKRLLVGDGTVAGTRDPARRRAKISLIGELPGELERIETEALEAVAAERARAEAEESGLSGRIDAEAEAREQADQSLEAGIAEAVAAEAEAREQADQSLEAGIAEETARLDELETTVETLESELESWKVVVAYLIQFVESKHGPVGGAQRIVVEGGGQLVTETGSYLITV